MTLQNKLPRRQRNTKHRNEIAGVVIPSSIITQSVDIPQGEAIFRLFGIVEGIIRRVRIYISSGEKTDCELRFYDPELNGVAKYVFQVDKGLNKIQGAYQIQEEGRFEIAIPLYSSLEGIWAAVLFEPNFTAARVQHLLFNPDEVGDKDEDLKERVEVPDAGNAPGRTS